MLVYIEDNKLILQLGVYVIMTELCFYNFLSKTVTINFKIIISLSQAILSLKICDETIAGCIIM